MALMMSFWSRDLLGPMSRNECDRKPLLHRSFKSCHVILARLLFSLP